MNCHEVKFIFSKLHQLYACFSCTICMLRKHSGIELHNHLPLWKPLSSLQYPKAWRKFYTTVFDKFKRSNWRLVTQALNSLHNKICGSLIASVQAKNKLL